MTTMAMGAPQLSSTLPVSAPPGFAAMNTLAAGSSRTADAAAVTTVSLDLQDVERLAAQERWINIYTSMRDAVVSFCIERSGEIIRVNVYFDKAIVGISFGHPRMSRTQSFRTQVDLSELRKIFRDPRVHTCDGYSNFKRQKMPKPLSHLQSLYAIGDEVHVIGYGNAVVVELPRARGDMVKIRFPDGTAFRAESSRLVQVDRRFPCECKSLAEEAELQLKRLDHELARITREKEHCEQILQLRCEKSPFASIDEVNKTHSPHLADNQQQRLVVQPSPSAVTGAFESASVDEVSSPKREVFLTGNHQQQRAVVQPSPRAVTGAFEPYNPTNGCNIGSIWTPTPSNQGSLGIGSTQSTILPPFPSINSINY